jgi:hypothetical protein
MAGWPPKGMKMPPGGPAAAQGRHPTEFSQRARSEEFSRQKSLRRAADRIGKESSGAGRNQKNRQ